MRIYANLDEMHSETERNLHSLGIVVRPATMQDKNVAGDPQFETLELSPHEFTILNFEDRNDWLVKHGGNLQWAIGEFFERARTPLDLGKQGPNPGQAWKLRAEVWEEFMHGRPPRFAYSYGERFGMAIEDDCTALQKVVQRLREDPDTRQAILPVFNASKDLRHIGGKRRVPCSLDYQFLIREDEVRMIYHMRSSDFYTHFIYDIWLATELQSMVAADLGRPVGRFTFFTGSLHIYQKDVAGGVF